MLKLLVTLPRKKLAMGCKGWAKFISSLIIVFATTTLIHAQDLSIDGKYQKLSTPQPTSDPDKIEVVEVFWYGCPHCNDFQPYLHSWLKKLPGDVAFVRMPAIFRPNWEIHAKAYYISHALGALDKIHDQLFAAIHQQSQPLNTKQALRKFFVNQGLLEKDFDKLYGSFGVDSSLRRSKVMGARYELRGVPSIIVNGKYRVSGSLAGSYSNVIRVVDALIEIERTAIRKQN